MKPDSIPSADRANSYNGGYMEAGRKAEEIVLKWLEARPWVVGVDDLREYRPMQKAEVDCGITLADGRSTLAEIKSDKWLGKSGNYLFESLRINHTAPADAAMVLGWSAKSPARWLLYWSPEMSVLHQVSMDDFRSAMQDYTRDARGKVNISYVPTDKIKSTVNILIPAKYIEGDGDQMKPMPTFRRHEVRDGSI